MPLFRKDRAQPFIAKLHDTKNPPEERLRWLGTSMFRGDLDEALFLASLSEREKIAYLKEAGGFLRKNKFRTVDIRDFLLGKSLIDALFDTPQNNVNSIQAQADAKACLTRGVKNISLAGTVVDILLGHTGVTLSKDDIARILDSDFVDGTLIDRGMSKVPLAYALGKAGFGNEIAELRKKHGIAAPAPVAAATTNEPAGPSGGPG